MGQVSDKGLTLKEIDRPTTVSTSRWDDIFPFTEHGAARRRKHHC